MDIKSNMRFFTFPIIGLFFLIANACNKEKVEAPVPETGTVQDIEGTVYKTIKIGNQWWMAENLKVKHYNDTTPIDEEVIPASGTNTEWAKKTTGAYCMYGYSPLYNWYAVSDSRKLAPKGWHVPSDEEWKELEKHLGMSLEDVDNTSWRGTHEGEKLKSTATNSWNQYGDVRATNASGFTALAGGCCMFDGKFGDPGQQFTGFWWSSTNHAPNNEAWYRYLDYKNANVFRYYGSKTYGFSVRCVKD